MRIFKKIFFLLLLPSFLFSKTYPISLESLKLLWNKHHYIEACEIADKLYEKNPYGMQTNLYYGKCASHKGETDKAMAAYDRAEILSDGNALVHQYLGDLYAKIGNFEIANSEYDKADRFGNAPVSRALLVLPDPNQFSLLLRLNVGFDSNVKYSAEHSDLNNWLGDAINLTSRPESAFFAKEYLRINHVYDSDPFSSFYYKNQLHIYNKNYETFHEEDFLQTTLYSGVGWASNTFDIWLPLSYGYIATGYEGYENIYAIRPQLRKRFDNRILLKVEARYEYKQYLQYDGGDRSTYSGKVSVSRWFGSNYFRFSSQYYRAKKEDLKSKRIFLDKDYGEFSLNYVRSITRTIEAGLGYDYRLSNYEDRVRVVSSEYREDELQEYSAYVSYDINQYIGLVLQYNHYDNKSNYTPSQYTKEVFSGGIFFYY
ncbi:MAG: hypothetical protein U9P71_06225 [Campylobacterota bacterium]|nr:hypothetical protein [Campylobacterota bacterium]